MMKVEYNGQEVYALGALLSLFFSREAKRNSDVIGNHESVVGTFSTELDLGAAVSMSLYYSYDPFHSSRAKGPVKKKR